MNPRERYFDNAATTPVDPRVLAEMLPYLENEFGNAHSIHGFGLRAGAAVDLARERVARLIGAEDPVQIIFTSGATEANNWVLGSFSEGWIGPFEHSAVREPAQALGFEVLGNQGVSIDTAPEPASFVSVMTVNNEIGTRWDVRRLAPKASVLHVDATQQVGKLPLVVEGLDYATFSGHKFYGPKGVGALYYADAPPEPKLLGGEQEYGARAGTLNVPGIVGMGAAAAIALDEMEEDLELASQLRAAVLDELVHVPDMTINGGEDVAPYILSMSFANVAGETLVIDADHAGYAISGGAACSSNATEPSHVLVALGLPETLLRGTIRVSFGRFNTMEFASALGKNLLISLEKLRRMK